ncbi:MAG: hypothetical protein ACREON_19410 [Gemmatimonadaceae bacterium]
MIQYHFRDAFAGLFEFPTDNARALIPPELQPVESHHGVSVLAVMVLDFTQSMVGAYGEVVFGVMVAPLIQPGTPMPRSAFYPFILGTTTREAREHAIERWHLPHHMQNVDVRVDRGERESRIHVSEQGSPIVELTIAEYEWRSVETHFQSFMSDDQGFYTSSIVMAGEFSEHEEERGSLRLHPHPMTGAIAIEDVSTVPFREQWMRNGVQSFHPLQKLSLFARR